MIPPTYIYNPESIEPNIIGSLIADVVLLFITLVGLLRVRFRPGDAFGLEPVIRKHVMVAVLVVVFQIY